MTGKPHRATGKQPRRAGGSREAAAERYARFEQAYLSNGHNKTEAAITAGYSGKTAYAMGHKLFKRLEQSGRLALAAEKAAIAAELSTQRTLQEVRNIAYNDPRRFFRDDGTLKPPKEWDGDMAACVSSIETIERSEPGQADDQLDAQPHGGALARKRNPKVAHVQKIKFWSKIDALDKAMRHAGLFERDNRQRQENLAIQINLVGGPEPRPANGGVQIQANLVGPNGKNGSHP